MKYIIILVLLISSCAKTPDFIPENKNISFKPISFKSLKGWYDDDLSETYSAFMNSCSAILKKSPDSLLDDSFIVQKTSDWQKICTDIKALEADDISIRAYLEKNMQPYMVTNLDGDEKEGIFTGYYEASLNGSFEKTDKYKYPLYGFPDDMIICNPSQFDVDLANKNLLGIVKNQRLIPYLTREDIETNGINAPVILWVDSLIDSFILHIQGSGIATLPNGNTVRVGYAGNNGHNFVGIGSIMSKEGLLEPGKASMPNIKEWLESNPEQAKILMQRNPRYIFFRIYEGEGPIGGLGVPLTAKRSIAVDNKYIPLGIPIWLDTQDSDGQSIDHMVFAQDIGSAINGVVRADFFWGYGEEAFHNAGRMKSKGQYYIILPK